MVSLNPLARTDDPHPPVGHVTKAEPKCSDSLIACCGAEAQKIARDIVQERYTVGHVPPTSQALTVLNDGAEAQKIARGIVQERYTFEHVPPTSQALTVLNDRLLSELPLPDPAAKDVISQHFFGPGNSLPALGPEIIGFGYYMVRLALDEFRGGKYSAHIDHVRKLRELDADPQNAPDFQTRCTDWWDMALSQEDLVD